MITLEELYEAKQLCKNLKKENKMELKGKSNILLTAGVYNGDDFYKAALDIDFEEKDFFRFEYLNIEYYNYLDAYLYLLNKKLGVNVIVNYLDCNYEKIYIQGSIFGVLDFKNLCAFNLYNDEYIKTFIKENNINALFHFVNTGRTTPFDIIVSERISSFSYLGLTGISKNIGNYLINNNIKFCYEYGWLPGVKEFKEYGYRFVDDVILYNESLLEKEILTNNGISSDRIWPRTVEFHFSPINFDLEKRVEIFNAIEDYLLYVERNIQEKGMYDALEPMRKRKVLIP